MGLAAIILVALIALAIAIIMLWGAFSALYRVGRFLWHLMFTGQWQWDKPGNKPRDDIRPGDWLLR